MTATAPAHLETLKADLIRIVQPDTAKWLPVGRYVAVLGGHYRSSQTESGSIQSVNDEAETLAASFSDTVGALKYNMTSATSEERQTRNRRSICQVLPRSEWTADEIIGDRYRQMCVSVEAFLRAECKAMRVVRVGLPPSNSDRWRILCLTAFWAWCEGAYPEMAVEASADQLG